MATHGSAVTAGPTEARAVPTVVPGCRSGQVGRPGGRRRRHRRDVSDGLGLGVRPGRPVDCLVRRPVLRCPLDRCRRDRRRGSRSFRDPGFRGDRDRAGIHRGNAAPAARLSPRKGRQPRVTSATRSVLGLAADSGSAVATAGIRHRRAGSGRDLRGQELHPLHGRFRRHRGSTGQRGTLDRRAGPGEAPTKVGASSNRRAGSPPVDEDSSARAEGLASPGPDGPTSRDTTGNESSVGDPARGDATVPETGDGESSDGEPGATLGMAHPVHRGGCPARRRLDVSRPSLNRRAGNWPILALAAGKPTRRLSRSLVRATQTGDRRRESAERGLLGRGFDPGRTGASGVPGVAGSSGDDMSCVETSDVDRATTTGSSPSGIGGTTPRRAGLVGTAASERCTGSGVGDRAAETGPAAGGGGCRRGSRCRHRRRRFDLTARHGAIRDSAPPARRPAARAVPS